MNWAEFQISKSSEKNTLLLVECQQTGAYFVKSKLSEMQGIRSSLSKVEVFWHVNLVDNWDYILMWDCLIATMSSL